MTTPGRLDATGAARAARPPSVPGRIAGVLVRPAATLQEVAGAPRWAAILLVTVLAAALVSAGVGATDAGQLAFIDRWEMTAYAFGHEMTDQEYAALGRRARFAGAYAGTATVLGLPALAIGAALAIYLGFGRRDRVRRSFNQVFAVAAHAGVVLAVRQIAATMAIAGTGGAGFAPGTWLPGVEDGTPAAAVLRLTDAFVVWWIALLGVGAAVLYGRPAGPVAVRGATFYVGLVLLAALAAALAGPAAGGA